MIHLFKHTAPGKLKGKFDIALVSKGRYIIGSNQGYERKSGAVGAARSLVKTIDTNGYYIGFNFQDDTFDPPVVYAVFGSRRPQKSPLIPSKPYIPNKK